MKKSTSTVIISFGIIQCLAVIGLMTFMQCKKTEPKPLKDIGKALNANDSIYLQKTALTPETKAALDLLAPILAKTPGDAPNMLNRKLNAKPFRSSN